MLLEATLLRDLRQPEYIHVLLNPLPVYGLLIGLIGLVLALILKSRRAQIATLALVFISSASAWPVYEFGQQGYDRVLSMTDENGGAWLDEHMHRAEQLIWIFYVLVALSAIAMAAPIKWPRSSVPLAVAVVLLGAVTLGSGVYIGYAGGRVRHREFRNEPAPPKRSNTSTNTEVIPSEVEGSRGLTQGCITGSFDSAALRSG